MPIEDIIEWVRPHIPTIMGAVVLLLGAWLNKLTRKQGAQAKAYDLILIEFGEQKKEIAVLKAVNRQRDDEMKQLQHTTQERINRQDAELKSQRDIIQGLEKKMGEQAEQHQRDKEKQDRQIEALKQSNDAKDKQIRIQADQIERVTLEIGTVQTQLTMEIEQRQSVERERDQYAQRVGELEKRVAELETEDKRKQERINALENEDAAKRRRIAQLEAELAQLRNEGIKPQKENPHEHS